jgi:hypothetical protein
MEYFFYRLVFFIKILIYFCRKFNINFQNERIMSKFAFLLIAAFMSSMMFGQTLNTIPKFGAGGSLNNSSVWQDDYGNVGIRTHLYLNSGGSSGYGGLYLNHVVSVDNDYASYIKVNRALTKAFSVHYGGQESVAFYGNGNGYFKGNVGIGMSPTSTSRLSVNGDSYFSNKVGIANNAPKEPFQIGDRWTFHNGDIKYIGYNMYYGANGDTRIFTDYSSALRMSSGIGLYVFFFFLAGTVVTQKGYLILNADGNVGIGISTVPTGYKLAVAGNVIAEKYVCKLKGSWPDFVFSEGYKLPNIFEVEQYIKEHKHLPNVPSANEIKENGIDIEEMNAAILKKIEEQMLYIIEQQKAIEQLNTEMQKFKNEFQNR